MMTCSKMGMPSIALTMITVVRGWSNIQAEDIFVSLSLYLNVLRKT